MTFKALSTTFKEQAQRLANQNAFFYFSEEKQNWETMSWKVYEDQVKGVAAWLSSQGVVPGDRVALLSYNRPEWIIADMAIFWLGAISVPIYATTTEKDVVYIAEHSEAKVFFVDNAKRAQSLKNTHVQSVVLMDAFQDKDISTLKAKVFPFKGVQATPAAAVQSPTVVKAEDIATIIYTSGTTGVPKGVMHSHGNISSAGSVVAQVVGGEAKGPIRFFSFLPLSHVAERMLVQMGSIRVGAEVAFARSVATLGEDLVRCRPTVLLCVPRLWEKMYERIEIGLSHAPLMKRLIFRFAKWLGSARMQGDRAVRSNSLRIRLSDALVGKAFRQRLGLDKAQMLLTGSAPTRADVMRFFASFGLFIREVYGLTENLCLGVYNRDETLIGSCGQAFPGNEIKIAADQEILFRAPWLFKGYYKNPEASAAAFVDGQWFATGDLGTLDAEGYLRIVGRKKELLKTSTGKYVAPVPIEDKIKTLSIVQDAMVVGDNQKYCIALIALEDGASRETCTNELSAYLNELNRSLANHESIKRIGILDEAFSVENGTLTPTLKLKRNAAFAKYETFINTVYTASETVVFKSR